MSGGEGFVVGIGASAGGLEAIERFFDHMPPDTGMSFAVVQHLSPDFKSLMDELLARHTNMPIHLVSEGVKMEPNGIYLIPPKKNIVLEDGRLKLTDQPRDGKVNLPIDIFFNSLASIGQKAVGVVLSGTGSDGSRGIKAISEAGGLVVVQDANSAAFDGMPRNAIQAGCADVVTVPAEMPASILDYVSRPDTFPRGKGEQKFLDDTDDSSDQLAPIFRLFRRRFDLDFRSYKTNTVYRRLERRMQLRGVEDLGEYTLLLEQDDDELDRLYRDLLVEVTRFFRDPEAFDRLRRDVVPRLVSNAANDRGSFRAWVCGTATGEEAFTVAMVVDSCARAQELDLDIKIFATDVYKASLDIGGSGVYSAEAVESVPEDLREQYFLLEGENYRIVPKLRELVVFAPHDVTTDTPFTKLDLLTCRNLLIYLQPEVQQRILTLFHFALLKDGVLFLGGSETVGELDREFEVVDKHWKMFRKLRDVRLHDPNAFGGNRVLRKHLRPPAPPGAARFGPADPRSMVFEELLQEYVPPSLLINERLELLHTFGNAREFLSVPSGPRSDDLLRMVDGDLRVAVNAAAHRCLRENKAVVYKGIRRKDNDQPANIRMVVRPYTHHQIRYLLICLEPEEVAPVPDKPAERPETGEHFDPTSHTSVRIAELERELDFTRESLQTTVEELETSNEELQSTNEELVAANEELQSTNEELHSVNEELYTVNSEHQRKIEELTEMTADMDNLFKSTGIGTIFLDRHLRIRKFTPAISDAFNLMEQDIGRPIDHIAYHLDDPSLLEHIHEVLDSGAPAEVEVRAKDGRVFHQRIRPYRSGAGSTEGAVLTFTDVTQLQETQRSLRETEMRFRDTVENVRDCIWITSGDISELLYVSPAFEEIWGRPIAEIRANRNLWMEAIHPEDAERVRQGIVRQLLRGRELVHQYRVLRPDGSVRWVEDHGTPVRDANGEVARIVGVAIDITHNKANETKLQQTIAEKDSLLKEIHHRVKNNLQVISSILRIQARNLENEHDRSLFQDCVDRVRVMAGVHDRLYQARNMAAIEMAEHLKALAATSIHSLQAPGQQITLVTDTEPLTVSLEQAVPIGLLANEAVCNAIKHGFTETDRGEIRVGLKRESKDWISLEIQDNGRGIPPGAEQTNGNGLGFSLIEALTEQIRGELEINRDAGTLIRVRIPSVVIHAEEAISQPPPPHHDQPQVNAHPGR